MKLSDDVIEGRIYSIRSRGQTENIRYRLTGIVRHDERRDLGIADSSSRNAVNFHLRDPPSRKLERPDILTNSLPDCVLRLADEAQTIPRARENFIIFTVVFYNAKFLTVTPRNSPRRHGNQLASDQL